MSLVVYESISYKKLVADHPPHVIHTEEENETYTAELEALYSQEELTPEESEYAELLKVLIEKFESRYRVEPAASPIDVVHHLMDARDLKQADMLDVFGSKGIASEVLSGKRELSKAHIQRLSRGTTYATGMLFGLFAQSNWAHGNTDGLPSLR
jgi:HTH-type transcriptional regulator/antitoxin HigA